MTRLLVALMLGGCSSKPTTGPGSGSGTPIPAGCEGTRGKVEQLYRVEAQVKQPKRVDETVADNTTMVMNDCAKEPDKVVGCINSISTIAELESKCLRPLDDEGTEGNALK